jgi:hypothetical protein
MEYMTKDELGRLLKVARRENEFHWQMILTGFYFGLRVSEVAAIMGEDVGGQPANCEAAQEQPKNPPACSVNEW